ncbi:hypothetical protein [Ruminococcus flavefaciens]|uniref:hypothetical protein n=1 Tax=Ruminococcus flavefaciens TaxID=1265 RepID=UPI000ACDC234|nr:hypothetical protein [Ruminococcus flavefaciens]
MDIYENFIYLEMRNYNCINLNKRKNGDDDGGDSVMEKEIICDYNPEKPPDTSGLDK